MSRKKALVVAGVIGLLGWAMAVQPKYVVGDMLCLSINGGSLTASDGVTTIGEGRYVVIDREGPPLWWRMLTFWEKEGRYQLAPIRTDGTLDGGGTHTGMLPVEDNSIELYRAQHDCPPKLRLTPQVARPSGTGDALRKR